MTENDNLDFKHVLITVKLAVYHCYLYCENHINILSLHFETFTQQENLEIDFCSNL